MMKKSIIYIFLIALLFVGCKQNNLNENKACVNIGFNSESRMVYPSKVSIEKMDLIEFYLDDELLDSWKTDEEKTAYANFWKHSTYLIDPGIHSFEFKLYDDHNNYFYGGRIENQEIIFGDNYINIQLERKISTGNLEIKLDWEKECNISFARAGIFLLNDYVTPLEGCDFESLEITFGEQYDSIVYSKDNIPTGDYFVKVELYNEANLNNPSYCEYDVYRIQGGSTTIYKELLNLYKFDEYYKLNYILGEGASWTGEAAKPYYIYNKKLVLPTEDAVKKEGYVFLGWYKDLNKYDSKVEALEENDRKEKTLYARWKKGVKFNISEFAAYMDELEAGSTTDEIILIDNSYSSYSEDAYNYLVAILKKAEEKNIKVNLDLSQTELMFDLTTFKECNALVKVTLPERFNCDVKFYDCINIKELIIPKSRTSNNLGGLSGKINIEKIIYEGDFKNFINLDFGYCALFGNTDEITHKLYVNSTELISGEVYIPEGIVYIRSGLSCYNNITKLILSSTVKSIWEDAFNSCSNLTFVSFGENLKCINDRAFCNCNKIESVTIPESVEQIGAYCFSNDSITFEKAENWYYLGFNEHNNWSEKTGGTAIENMNDFYNKYDAKEGYINRKYRFYRVN